MDKIKNTVIAFFKSFNLFEVLFLIFGLAAELSISIIFKSDALTFVYSIVSVVAVVTLFKGMVLSPIFQIVAMSLYIAQAWTQQLYGEMILYGAILIPLQIYAAFSWLKNRGKGSEVKTNDISKKEWLSIFACTLVLIAPVFFGLRALHTNQLIVSTFTFIIPIISNYLTMRRSVFQYVFYILQDIFLIILWLLPIFQGLATIKILPMAIVYLIFGISDVYGIINWKKLGKKQKFWKKIPNQSILKNKILIGKINQSLALKH